MDRDEILLDAEDRMEKAVEVVQNQFQGIRTGRATLGLVDSIRADLYGVPTPIKQMASITCPEPQQILIRPFDVSTVNSIVKAIQGSDVGLSPNSDGRLIRLNVPPLSTERRRQMVSRIKEIAEEGRVAIRNVRRDANKQADQSEKEKVFGEDDCKALKEEIQDLTKRFEAKVNDLAAAKEKEVMEG